MMISRKRRNSPTLISPGLQSKRARILSELWRSEESQPVDPIRRTERSRRNSRAQSVIAKKADIYLINKAEDILIKLKTTSSRQPEKIVVDRTSVTWKSSTNASDKARNSNRPILRRRRDEGIESGCGRQPNRNKSSPLVETSSELVEIARDLSPPAVTESRTSIIRKSGLSDLTVRISQHSSLDRDQYLSYKSSLSSQSIFASRPSYLETESGESLLVPLSDIQSEPKPCQSDIFPDSQSAAGSSSYVPTSSTFLNEASSNDSAEGDSPHSNSPNTRTNHSGFSSSVRSNTNQTCQIVPSTTVSASQDFLRSQRADSAPLQSSPTALQPTSLVEVEATQVFRSRLDSPSIISDSLGRGSSHLTQETVSSSRGLDPRWSLRQFHPTREFGVDDLDLGINFQTQTSLALGSQPNLGSSESIGDNWQSGQIVRRPIDLASQISVSSVSRQRSAVSENTTTLEESISISQTPLPTEASTLSPRHLESQIDQSQSAQAWENFIVSTIDSQVSEIEEVADSLSSRGPSQRIRVLKLNTTLPTANMNMSDQADVNTGSPSPAISTVISANRIPPRAGFFSGVSSRTTMAGILPVSGLPNSTASGREPARTNHLLNRRPFSSPGTPSTPSSVAGVPAMTLREKLRAMRENSRANYAAHRASMEIKDSMQAEKSPSVISENLKGPEPEEKSRLEVQPLKIPVEVPLPVRVVQPAPHTPTNPSKLSFHTEASRTPKRTTLIPTHLREMEFIIPLSMNPRVRDQYITTIKYYQKDISKFLNTEIPEERVVERVKVMLDRVKRVATHIDLDNGVNASQGQEEAENEALWAETCSAKFLFLRHFLDSLRYQDQHIAIVARSGQLHDIIELFLKGKQIKYSRPATVSRSLPSLSKGRLQVTLIASGEEGASSLPKPANLVLAFDGSFNRQDVQVGLLRNHLVNVGQLAPVIHLLVYKSAEHIERCIPESINPLDRLKNIISCMVQTQDDVGLLLPDEAGTAAVAEEAVAFLEAGGLDEDWTFPAIRPIEDVDLIEVADLKAPELLEQPVTEANAMKRALDTEQDRFTPPKRQRSTPAGVITQISDSIPHDSQPIDIMAAARRAREVEFRKLQVERDNLEKENAGLIGEREALQSENNTLLNDQAFASSERHYLKKREETLQASLEKTEKQRVDLDQSLGELQYRYESKYHQARQLQYTRDELVEASKTAKWKIIQKDAEITRLTNSRAKLEQEVENARMALRSSTVPTVAELETVNAELRSLRAASAALEKKVAAQNQDFDYMRQQYQQASTAAAEAVTQVSRLETELAAAQQKASGEATRLAEINRDSDLQQAHARIEQLKLETASRERLLQKQGDELRDARRGRGGVVTRGSSVQAKSPRGGGSRGGSPGVGGAGVSSGAGGKVGGSGLRFGSGVGEGGGS